MTRKQKRIYQKAFHLLQNATPLRTDCGVLCGKACCKGDDMAGMLLFPGEPTTLRVIATEGRRLAVCAGRCARRERPLSCRIFPFVPALQPDGSVRVQIDPRGKGVCPLVRQSQNVLFSHRFLHRVRRAGALLCRDEGCRAFLLGVQQEMEAQRALEAQLCEK